jgi:hypothetical protein
MIAPWAACSAAPADPPGTAPGVDLVDGVDFGWSDWTVAFKGPKQS